jgi:L-aspartate oxidase
MKIKAACPIHYTDFLVIGSGVAGLTYALNTALHGTTTILTKKNRAESNSNYAQGGIAGVMDENDDVHLHLADTLVAGAGICHEDAVETLVTEGPDRIRELIKMGAKFNMYADTEGIQHLALGREGGHSRNRIVHAVDRTGYECERTLLHATRDLPDLHILDDFYVIDLLVMEENGKKRCAGAIALDTARGEIQIFGARSVLLASGGCGRLYQHTTNPAVATGDGVAMAWRAGAAIANMEFIQFHPTCLYHTRGDSFLISEAVRGEGGILRTADGSTFMENYHPLGALAPRDIVARAIHAERIKRGEPCVFLDVTHLDKEFVRRRFPTIFKQCLEYGINMNRQPIPVVPAAHYMCGGVQADLDGQTSMEGLFAAGEVSCTGVHGANRLASNSLLEAMVWGHRAARKVSDIFPSLPAIPEGFEVPVGGDKTAPLEEIFTEKLKLQSIMNDLVGIVRNNQDLHKAEDQIQSIAIQTDKWAAECFPDPDLYELRNMAEVALLIIRSALSRKESRGLHYTTDYGQTDDISWKHDTVLIKNE